MLRGCAERIGWEERRGAGRVDLRRRRDAGVLGKRAVVGDGGWCWFVAAGKGGGRAERSFAVVVVGEAALVGAGIGDGSGVPDLVGRMAVSGLAGHLVGADIAAVAGDQARDRVERMRVVDPEAERAVVVEERAEMVALDPGGTGSANERNSMDD